MYGDSIRAAALHALRALGVQHAHLTIEDQGAMPFVIAARVEAAARRAGYASDVPLADLAAAGLEPRAHEPTARGRLRRSRLYLPGNEPKFMFNAGLHAPDAVILDLEDSVHAEQKDAARLLVRNALQSVDFMAAERMVRINQLPLGLADLDAVVPQRPHLILIPKVERPEQVREVAEHIRSLQPATSGAAPIWLMPILESALGVENAFAIATADDSVAALTIGLEDYTADLGVVKTTSGEETMYGRMRMVNAARAAGLQAIDSVYGDVADEDGLLAWGRRSRALGFDGMGCVHPRQIRVIHEAFAPSPEEIERALRIVGAWREAERQGLGVVSLGSKMIDPPVVLRARRLVERARNAGLVDEEVGS
jgi:citrate lyase subunit beta/citryl-CoA lyase